MLYVHLGFHLPSRLERLAASFVGIAPVCVSNSSLVRLRRVISYVPVVNTVDCCVTTVAALIDDPPYVILTIGLRNGLPPTLVVGLELVTPPIPISAGMLGLWRVVGSR